MALFCIHFLCFFSFHSILLLLVVSSLTSPSHPYTLSPERILRRFSTKTSYDASVAMDVAMDDIFHHQNPSKTDIYGTDFEQGGESAAGLREGVCRAAQIVGLLRHGTRYPGEEDVVDAREALVRMRAAVEHGAGDVEAATELLDQLSISLERFDVRDCKELAQSGREEHHAIGRRLRQRYSDLFDGTELLRGGTELLRGGRVRYVSSSKSRCIGSYAGFREGFGDLDPEVAGTGEKADLMQGMEVRDDLLRFFDACALYVSSIGVNKSAIAEVKLFQKSRFSEVIRSIAGVLGVDSIDLSFGQMKSMYVLAASEIAIHGTAHWNRLFTDDDLELLEYAADIKNYWKKAYGYKVNYEPSCVLLRDMFQSMDDLVNGNSSVARGVFYFGHTETVVPVLSLLGLFRDSAPLRADNYGSHGRRLFRTSRVSPFSTNLAFVLHDCAAETREQKNGDDYELEFLFKERPLVLPPCVGLTKCTYSLVRAHYAPHIDRCHFDSMCQLGVTDSSHDEL